MSPRQPIIELATKDDSPSLAAAQRILIYDCCWNILSAKLIVAQMKVEAATLGAQNAVQFVDAGIEAIHYIVQIMDRAKRNPSWTSKH